MKKNMGITDRLIRILIAATLIVLFISQVITGVWGFVLLAIGVIFTLTSVVGVCPLYSVFGINTRRLKKA